MSASREADSGGIGAGNRGIRHFSTVLDLYPAGFSGNLLNLLFLDDAEPIGAPLKYLRQLDAPGMVEDRREYVLGHHPTWPFPVLNVKDRPDPWELSFCLFKRFDKAAQVLPTQKDIGRLLVDEVRRYRPELVALMVVDGLSYYDLPPETEAQPCLVDGVSTTEFGFRQVIADSNVSHRLFSLGYTEQVGYTYFAPAPGTLASDVLSTFSVTQVVKVRSFDEILQHLAGQHLQKGYIQVAAPGLDELSHSHRDVPPREHYRSEIMARFQRLLDCLASPGRRVLGCLTADHGILWREVIESRVEIAGDLFSEDIRSPRFIRGTIARNYARSRRCLGQSYALLRVPYLTRNLRSDEWGVHGGISAWESLVPLIVSRVTR